MTITITPPLTTPANIVATPQAGGSLAASTRYYYRILAQNSTSVYYMPAWLLRSAWSPEQYFDTDATNKQAAITWDAVAGATGYVVILSTVSGDYTGSKRLGAVQHPGDHNHQQLYGHRRSHPERIHLADAVPHHLSHAGRDCPGGEPYQRVF